METENQIVSTQNIQDLGFWSRVYNRISRIINGTKERPKVHKDGSISYIDEFGRYVEETKEQSLNKSSGEKTVRRISRSMVKGDMPTIEEIEVLNHSYTVDDREFVRAEEHTLYDSEEKYKARIHSSKYKISIDSNGGFIKIVNKEFDGGSSKTVTSKELDDSYLDYARKDEETQEDAHTFKIAERRVNFDEAGEIQSREKTTRATLEESGKTKRELTFEYERIGKRGTVDYKEIRSRWELGDCENRIGFGNYIEENGIVKVAQGNQAIILVRNGDNFRRLDQFTLGDLIDIESGEYQGIQNKDVIKVSKNTKQANHFIATTYLPQEETEKLAPQLFRTLAGMLGIEKPGDLHIGYHPEVYFKDKYNPLGTNFLGEIDYPTMGITKLTREMVYGEESGNNSNAQRVDGVISKAEEQETNEESISNPDDYSL